MEDQYLPFTKDGVTLREEMEVFREPTISVDDSGKIVIDWRSPRAFVIPPINRSLYLGDALVFDFAPQPGAESFDTRVPLSELHSTKESAIASALGEIQRLLEGV